ncbi:hypothetical protein SUGI_0392000 [Cryptomeria japonica]|nr:hypothetical protein SUGI_0392000 [Cryptomeria japonica]
MHAVVILEGRMKGEGEEGVTRGDIILGGRDHECGNYKMKGRTIERDEGWIGVGEDTTLVEVIVTVKLNLLPLESTVWPAKDMTVSKRLI